MYFVIKSSYSVEHLLFVINKILFYINQFNSSKILCFRKAPGDSVWCELKLYRIRSGQEKGHLLPKTSNWHDQMTKGVFRQRENNPKASNRKHGVARVAPGLACVCVNLAIRRFQKKINKNIRKNPMGAISLPAIAVVIYAHPWVTLAIIQSSSPSCYICLLEHLTPFFRKIHLPPIDPLSAYPPFLPSLTPLDTHLEFSFYFTSSHRFLSSPHLLYRLCREIWGGRKEERQLQGTWFYSLLIFNVAENK